MSHKHLLFRATAQKKSSRARPRWLTRFVLRLVRNRNAY